MKEEKILSPFMHKQGGEKKDIPMVPFLAIGIETMIRLPYLLGDSLFELTGVIEIRFRNLDIRRNTPVD